MKHILSLSICLYLATPNILKSEVINLIDEKEFDEVIKSTHPVIVKFFANWCGVCNGIKKPFEELSQDPAFSTISFVCIDIDRFETLSQKHGIVGVPSFLFFDKGQKKNAETGVQALEHFKHNFKEAIQTTFALPHNQSESDRAEHQTNSHTSSILDAIKRFFYAIWESISRFFRNLWMPSR